VTRLEPGDQIPPFSVRDHAGDPVTDGDLRGQATIIYFYPAAFTPGCTTEACDFRDQSSGLSGAGYRIVGVSPDTVEEIAKFRDEYSLGFDLLADPDHEMAEAFGAWGIKTNYGREYEGLIRSTFVVDEDGTLRSAHYNVKATGHAERIARSVLS